MKKILIAMLFCLLLITLSIPRTVLSENYTTFEEIVFDSEDIVLIDNWSYYKLNGYLGKLKKKGFGWSTYYSNKKEHFSYVAETLYHVKNNGTDNITHTFKYEESYEETVQRTVSGSLETEVSYNKEKKKESKFKFGLESELKYEYKDSQKTKTTESDTVKIVIAPNSELYIKVLGEGYLYQGVARKYFMFIPLKEGAFEYAIITTEYYSIDMDLIDSNKTNEVNNNEK